MWHLSSGHNFNQLLIYIVDNRETLVNDLGVHLNKTKKSLQQICFDLLEDNDLNYAIDFIISALSVMLEIPILMVCPIQHKSKTNEIYYSYQEHFFINVKMAVFSEENLTFFYECQNSSVLRGEL